MPVGWDENRGVGFTSINGNWQCTMQIRTISGRLITEIDERNPKQLGALDLRDAAMAGLELEGAILENSDLSRADLTGADLYWGYMRGARLRDACLQRAILRGASLEDADLRGANLQYADFSLDNLGGSTSLKGADLRGANVIGALFYGAEYNERTLFPEGFDPLIQKMVRVIST